MGKQSMYHIEITIDVKGHGESDIWAHQFGFRKIESTIDSITGGRYTFILILKYNVVMYLSCTSSFT